jgi:hypothetical protein
VTLSGIAILHLFDWEIKLTQQLLDASGHGDEWEQWVPLRQGWTGRARGYMTRGALTADTYVAAAKLSDSPAEMVFTGWSDMGMANATRILVGTIYWEDITIAAPNAMVTQEISFRGNMAPTVGPA